MISDKEFFFPESWTYAYDHSVLLKTLEKYIDYRKLSSNSKNSSVPRLVVTAVNVMTAEHLVYDSWTTGIEGKHLLASTAYPAYWFPWVKLDEGVYGWDGALMSNTPLREVLDVSPRNDKNIYIIENYQKITGELPSNRAQVIERTRDITFSDKTTGDIEMTNKMSRLIDLVERLYDVLDDADALKNTKQVQQIKQEYKDLVEQYGAEILSVKRFVREDDGFSSLYKNADFSIKAIKELIAQGEETAKKQIAAV